MNDQPGAFAGRDPRLDAVSPDTVDTTRVRSPLSRPPGEPPRSTGSTPLSDWPGSLEAVPPLEATREGAYSPPPARGPHHRRRRRWHIVAVVALVLGVLALGLAYALNVLAPRNQQQPEDAVVAYLAAVARADAAGALALQENVPSDHTLLTTEVLLASRDRTPISDIRVNNPGNENLIRVTYRLGQRDVTAEFEPVRQRDGTYKVRTGTTRVEVSLPNRIPVFVNKQAVTTWRVDAFPGSYELSTGLAAIQFAEPDFIVSGPGSAPRIPPAAELSDAGRRAFLVAARDRLEQCLRAQELNPPDCPQHVVEKPNQDPDETTIEWTLVSNPFQSGSPQLNVDDERIAEMRLSVDMRLRASITQDGEPGTVDEVITFATTATGDVVANPVQVRFENS